MHSDAHLVLGGSYLNPYDTAHQLARTIRDVEAFHSMKTAKERIQDDENAKRMLNDFHMKQLQFEQKRLLGQEPSEDEQEALQKLYEILQLHSDVRDYLLAEYQLGILMQDVHKILGDVLEEVSII